MRMKHIFISYKREDAKLALMLRQALRAEGFNVWWDEDLQTGEQWEERIDQALISSEAIVVIWSSKSINSEWVKHEASIGKIRGILTHSLFEGCEAPAFFKSIHAIDLSDWDGQENDHGFVKLVGSIRHIYKKRILRFVYKTIIYMAVIFGTFIAGYYYSNTVLQAGRDIQLTPKDELVINNKSPGIPPEKFDTLINEVKKILNLKGNDLKVRYFEWKNAAETELEQDWSLKLKIKEPDDKWVSKYREPRTEEEFRQLTGAAIGIIRGLKNKELKNK